MRTDLRNQVTMFKTSIAQMNDNQTIWSGMPALADAMTRAQAKLDTIDATAELHETPSGAAEDKEAARDLLEDRLFLVCQALSVLAHRQNDHELSAMVDLGASRLQKMNGEELSNRASRVISTATEKLSGLAGMNVTQTTIDNLQQALDNFNSLKERPRQATATREGQTETLRREVRELRSIFRHEIDPLVNLQRETHPEFVAAYRAARVVVDRAATRATKPSAPTTPTTPTTPKP